MHAFIGYDFNVSLISLATYVPPGTGNAVHRNRKFHGIAYNCAGLKEYVFEDGRTILLEGDEMIYLPKHSNYTVRSMENGGCYAINFDLSEDIRFDPFSYRPKNQQVFGELFQNAEDMWRLKKNGYMLKCRADLYNILYSLQSEYHLAYIQKDKMNVIRPAMEYIKEHYTDGVIGIPRLARLCGTSEVYFRSLFLKLNGITPIKYMNNLRITRARELILSGYYTIHEAAALSGFGDDSYFSREFKRHTGFSPSEYRKINE